MLEVLRQHCRRVLIEITLDRSLHNDDQALFEFWLDSLTGIGTCYHTAVQLGLASVRPGVGPGWCEFADLIVPDDVNDLIESVRAEMAAIWPLTGHDTIRLRKELGELVMAAPAFDWPDPATLNHVASQPIGGVPF